MSKNTLGSVHTVYIIGRVVRRIMRSTGGCMLQVLWLDSQFHKPEVQFNAESANYRSLGCFTKTPAWRNLTDDVGDGELGIDAPLDELEISTGNVNYPTQFVPAALAEVETVKTFRFEPDIEMSAPNDLYEWDDHLFTHSVCSSCFAYVPIYFWE
ncbi:hypothetical protein PHMEG_00015891 [Phytophthora megakarya]|uniref:Uncharacterized protein n=1 Tax=Phytophthora megakarya TaxID=4795 RepID=A0A225W2A2_9STRA|nr:hypothetical protein PHMEG_00015891 [Phytophthora megakarya]